MREREGRELKETEKEGEGEGEPPFFVPQLLNMGEIWFAVKGNKTDLSYSLSHLLFKQGMISPSLPSAFLYLHVFPDKLSVHLYHIDESSTGVLNAFHICNHASATSKLIRARSS